MKLAWVWRAGITLLVLGLTSHAIDGPNGLLFSSLGSLLALTTVAFAITYGILETIETHRRPTTEDQA